MNSISNILKKSIVVSFYRSHAGLLIFVFLVMFGTVESRYLINYHETLILGMFSSRSFMLAICFVWTLYSLKIVLYILSLLKKHEYVFLNNLMLIPKSKAFTQILIVVVYCFLPVLAYSIFIYRVGISEHHLISSGAIFLFHSLLCSATAFVIWLFLRTQHKFSWKITTWRMPNVGGRIGFYISHVLNEEKIGLLISKFFSLGLLYLVREATQRGDDVRILGLTWVFVLLAHTFLVLKVKTFEDRYLAWSKGLPLPVGKTCLMYFCFYAGLLLPEIFFSLGMIGNVFEPISLIILSAGTLMFVHAYLLKSNRDPDQFSTFLFWLFMLTFFAVLSKLIIVWSIGLVGLGSVRIIQRYYRYEPVI